MKDATGAFLALLLFCSLPATAALGSAQATEQSTNEAGLVETNGTNEAGLVETNETTNRLGLDGDVRREYASPGPNMGSTFAAADAELRVDHESFVVGHGFEDASETEQREQIEAGLDRVDERIRALEAREERAVERHADGEISDTTLVQVMVTNYNEAGEISDMLDEIRDRSNAISSSYYDTVRDDVREEKSRLDRYRSALRSYLDATSHEEREADGGFVVVDTRADGYRLATIRGSTYVYETARFDNHNETESDQFEDIIEAENYAKEHYPWADQSRSGASFTAMFSYGLYRLQILHDQGTLEAYFNGGTRAVTYETQELSIDELPTSTGDQVWVGGGLTISLSETPGGGPAKVTVTDWQTAEPVDATIAVNDTVVGETNDDGTRWIVSPIGEYELRVEAGDASVSVSSTGSTAVTRG